MPNDQFENSGAGERLLIMTHRGPQFVQYFGPVLDALRALGGSARPGEVVAWIANELQIPQSVLDEELPSGGSRFSNQIHWARFYLTKAGLLDSSKRGVWSLTDAGRETRLELAQAMKIFREVRRDLGTSQTIELNNQALNDDEAEIPEKTLAHRRKIMSILTGLPPDGFERLCQRLLRESGFENVVVTGRSGDGGIDGHGILRINPLVSFYVYFQCKRYRHPVGPSVVRDFRGAMLGRADKGIILTTATFTSEARKEAVRDGVPPIELVDGDALVDMLENLELGLVPQTIFEVDEAFFKEFGYTP